MRKTITCILLLVIVGSTQAQTPSWLWAISFGTVYDNSYAVAAEPNGNIYITGTFAGSADFDPGPGTYVRSAAGSYDVFVSKFDPYGNFIWAKVFGGRNSDGGQKIVFEDHGAGSIYIAGYFRDTADFNPLGGGFTLMSYGGKDAFVLKLDTAGNFGWVDQIGGSYNYDEVYDLKHDPVNDGVLLSVFFTGTMDADPGPATLNQMSAGWTDISLIKLNTAGSLVFTDHFGGNGNDGAREVLYDPSGNFYITGYFYNSMDVDPGSGTFNLTYAGGTFTNTFLAKYDSSGNFIWAFSVGNAAGYGNGISLSQFPGGDIALGGRFSASTDFDPGAGTHLLTSSGGADIFYARYDSSGHLITACSFGGPAEDDLKSMLISQGGNVLLCGSFKDSIDLDPSTIVNSYHTSNGGFDMFFVTLDGLGNFNWAKTTGSVEDDYCMGTALAPDGDALVTGYYNGGTIAFDQWTLHNTMSLGGSPECFVAKLDLDIQTGYGIPDDDLALRLFPNPAVDHLMLITHSGSPCPSTLTIVDQLGATVYCGSFQEELDVHAFCTGIYRVRVEERSGLTFSGVFIKE